MNNILGLKINNILCRADKEYTAEDTVEVIDIRAEEGYYIYRRTLFLIAVTAFRRLYPSTRLKIHRSINKSTFCRVYSTSFFGEEEINALKNEMKKIVEENREIKEKGTQYAIDDTYIDFGGMIAVSTGVIDKFDIVYREGGFVLLYPNHILNGEISPYSSSEHLMRVIDEYRSWSDILKIKEVRDINKSIEKDGGLEMINIQDALHDKKLNEVANKIKLSQPNVKVVLITGPSSSGKTTFSRKLAVNLRANGMNPINISLDDYYHNRDKTPKNSDGTYNFEDLEAIDYELFNIHLSKLIKGQEVEIPIFDFTQSKRSEAGKKIRLREGGVLIVEGIHALNEKLSYLVDTKNKYKIYCSPLADLNITDHYPVATSDIRLIRRMVRDNKYRNSDIENTLSMWESVQKGEIKNIFHYDEAADCIFNTAVIYEFCVFKPYIVPLLKNVDKESKAYFHSQRLLHILDTFSEMCSDFVPSTSILREFIGGSSYHGN